MFSRDYYHISAVPKLSCKISHVKTFQRKKGFFFFFFLRAPEAASRSRLRGRLNKILRAGNNHRPAQGETWASGSKVNASTEKKKEKKKKDGNTTCSRRKEIDKE